MVEDFLPEEPFYSAIMLTVQGHAPLLADAGRARLLMRTLDACAAIAPGRLWGYVILPHAVRLVVGPGDDVALHRFVEVLKARAAQEIIEAVRRADDESLDIILRYSPVWGAPIYRVWDAGFHCTRFWSEYKLSNAIHALRQAPVEAGLVAHADEWPFRG